jgi:NAD(P)H-flavin reductase
MCYRQDKGPLMKAIECRCEVKSFTMLTPTVFEIHFKTDPSINFIAGQFVSVIIPGAGPKGRDLRRAYSIASCPEGGEIELCVKIVEDGPGTQYLNSLRPGNEFRVMAPYGDFVYHPKSGRHACFIATGTGIAPFRSMITSQHYRDNKPTGAHCMLGVRTEDELLYSQLLGNIPEVKFIEAGSPPTGDWKGFKGRVTDYIRTLGDDFPWTETEYYLCGHGGMISEVKAYLTEKGVAKDSMHQEIYYK